MTKIGIGVSIVAILIGSLWQAKRLHDDLYISKLQHERVLAQTTDKIEQKTKDATNEKKRIADEAAKEADAVPLDVPADIERLCQRSASCRDREGR